MRKMMMKLNEVDVAQVSNLLGEAANWKQQAMNGIIPIDIVTNKIKNIELTT